MKSLWSQWMQTGDEHTLNDIMVQCKKVVSGVIYTHRFQVHEPYEDCLSEGLEAVLKALPRFDPQFITSKGEKVKLFSYVSLTAKRSIMFYTLRQQKYRQCGSIENAPQLSTMEHHDGVPFSVTRENFIKGVSRVISKRDARMKRKKMLPLVDVLNRYLSIAHYFNKMEFYRYARSEGWKDSYLRLFMAELIENSDELKRDTLQS